MTCYVLSGMLNSKPYSLTHTMLMEKSTAVQHSHFRLNLETVENTVISTDTEAH